MPAGPPSRLLDRVVALLEGERGKEQARTLGVQWHRVVGTEDLEAAIEAAEADAAENGETSFEFFVDEFEQMGFSFSAGEFAPMMGPRRKPKPKPKPKHLIAEPMPTVRELKAAAAMEPARSLKDAWPKIERNAYGYALDRKFKAEEFQDLADIFADRHRDERRSDWLLAWKGLVLRRANKIFEAENFRKYGFTHY
jgi:hypothetical protein